MKRIFVFVGVALVCCCSVPASLTTNPPVGRTGTNLLATNAPGGRTNSGSTLNLNPPAAPSAFKTGTLFFAPSNSPYTAYAWTGTAYTNSTLRGWMRTNATTHRWEYLTNTTLVATNSFATNVWRGTNGLFWATSYWAAASSVLGTNAPGKRNPTSVVSTNSPVGKSGGFVPTTNAPKVRYILHTNLVITIITNFDLSVIGAGNPTNVNGDYKWFSTDRFGTYWISQAHPGDTDYSIYEQFGYGSHIFWNNFDEFTSLAVNNPNHSTSPTNIWDVSYSQANGAPTVTVNYSLFVLVTNNVTTITTNLY